MKLIVDSGSTKARWCVIEGREIVSDFSSRGINPVTMDAPEIERIILENVMPELGDIKNTIDEVFYYGAGCRGGKLNISVETVLKRWLPNAGVAVDSDMVGAAKALLGDAPGIACILGTGSNSCMYDGKKIVDNVPSLGYILGDEGSGAYLGKMLINKLFKRELSQEIVELFESNYHLSGSDVIEKVYKGYFPNRFLASFAPFIKENIRYKELEKIVTDGFIAFFENNVMRYEGYERCQIGFIGSIAYNFSPLLHAAAQSVGINIGKILSSPLDGLIQFHASQP